MRWRSWPSAIHDSFPLPRRIGTIASIAVMPVCIAHHRLALNMPCHRFLSSRGSWSIIALASQGRPSGFTRPSMPHDRHIQQALSLTVCLLDSQPREQHAHRFVLKLRATLVTS